MPDPDILPFKIPADAPDTLPAVKILINAEYGPIDSQGLQVGLIWQLPDDMKAEDALQAIGIIRNPNGTLTVPAYLLPVEVQQFRQGDSITCVSCDSDKPNEIHMVAGPASWVEEFQPRCKPVTA